jgi:predicted RND superfamily exporter protein
VTQRLHPHILRLAGWIDRRRRWILAASLAVVLGAGWLASRLPILGDFSHLLPPDTPSVQALRLLEARIPSFGTIMVVAESADPALRARAAEALARRFQALDRQLVASVTWDDRELKDFVWNNRFLFADLADLTEAKAALDDKIRRGRLTANPLYVDLESPRDAASAPAEPDRTAELRRRLRDAEAAHDGPSGFVSPDGVMQLLVIRTTFDSSAVSLATRLVAGLDAAMDAVRREVGPGVKIAAQGDVYTALAEQRALLRGVLLATLLTVVVVAFGLLLYYRSLRALAALLWALAVGTVITFGLTRLAIGHLNLATAFLSSIVVGNGINFGIVLVARYLEERRGGLRGADAIGAAMVGTFTGTLTAALTASVAYASLVITNFKGFQHFGVIGGMGMIICWIAAYTVLPAALAVLERRGSFKVGREPALGPLLARLLPRRLGVVAAVGVVVTVVSGVASVRYLASDPMEKVTANLLSDTPELEDLRARLRRIDVAFSRDISGGFVVAAPDRASARQVVATMRRADEGKRPEQRLFSGLQSLDDAIPRDQGAKLALLAEIRRKIDDALPDLAPADQKDLLGLRPPDGLRPLGDEDVPEVIAGRFTEKDGTRGRLILADTAKGFDTGNLAELIRFSDAVRSLDLGPGAALGGSMFVFADVLRSTETDGPRATLAALVGAVLVVLLLVGFNRHAVITLACSVAGVVLMLAVCSLLALKVNFLDFVALPITIGIGIDYAVNIVARERQSGPGTGILALRTVGGAVAVCSFTTIVGYGSLLLSANRGIRSFGTAAIVGEITCLLVALTLAPALLHLLRPRRTEAKGAGPVEARYST